MQRGCVDSFDHTTCITSVDARTDGDPKRQRRHDMTQTTESAVLGEARMLIDGDLVPARSGATFDNINPATEQVLGPVADAGVDDVDAAIAAARRAADNGRWSNDLDFRKRCLLQLHAALVAEREELRREIVAETGSPIVLTYGPQVDGPLDELIPWVVDNADRFEWERELPTGTAFGTESWRRVLKEPVGVVSSIVPWNYPFEVSLVKIAQALIAGNTTILKPAPNTPWNATRIGRLVAEHTDIPAGVLNVVTTADNTIAERLVVDERIDMVSFTGSTAVGKRIYAAGAATMKRLFLELGGKSAAIVLDDADIAAVVPGVAASICAHGVQGCAMVSRLLVPRSRYEEAVAVAEAGMRAVPYGDPTDPSNIQGPQVSAVQRERVLGYISAGVDEGARVVVGGGRPDHLEVGYYVEPTLFADVENSMTIAQEEIFGPVMAMIPFDDDDDAVRIANDSVYGLGLAVLSASENRALSVGKRIRTGTVSINGGMWYGPAAPFGGYKQSGIGRQNGTEGFEQYTETKTIAGPQG